MTEVAATSALPGRAEAMLADRFELRVHRGATLTGEDELAAFIGAAAGAVTLLGDPRDAGRDGRARRRERDRSA
jgi:hypothetical protein